MTSKSTFKMTVGEIQAATKAALLSGDRATLISGISTDSRCIAPGEVFVTLRGENFDGHDFLEVAISRGAKACVVERPDSISHSSVAVLQVENAERALGDMARAWRNRYPVPIVALTGTSGKTSTKNLIADCLAHSHRVLATPGNWNNAIGVPKTLFMLGEEIDVAVVEMGMNHPGEIRRLAEIAAPQYGLITNIGEGHTAGVGGIEGVKAAKGELLEGLGETGFFFANREDSRILSLAENFSGEVLYYGFDSECDVAAERLRMTPTGLAFSLRTPWERADVESPFWGPHQVINAVAAVAVAQAFHVPLSDCIRAIQSAGGAMGRGDLFRLKSGALVLDEAYNANPVSTRAALQWFLSLAPSFSRKIFAFGTMGELDEAAKALHEEMIEWAKKVGVTELYLFGEWKAVMAARARDLGYPPEAVHGFDTVEELGKALVEIADERAAILVKASHSGRFDRIVEELKRC